MSRTYPVPDRAMVAYQRPKRMSEEAFTAFINQAAHDVLVRYGADVIVVGLDAWRELRVLDQAEMEKRGWIHKDRVFLLKSDVSLSDRSEEDMKEIVSAITNPLPSVDEEE